MGDTNPRSRTETVTSSATGGPERISNLFANQLESAVKSTGGLPAALRPIGEAAPSGDELGFLRGMQARAGAPILSGGEAAGIETLRGLSDPTAMIDKSRDYFERIAAPVLLNQASASGVGARSGGATEALARGGAELTLPSLQAANTGGLNLAKAQFDLGRILEDRELSRLATGYGAARVPRLAALEERLRPINTILHLLTGAAGVSPGSRTVQTTSGGGLSSGQLGLGAGSIAANLIGSLW